jgi:hypothetical protein
MDLRRHHIDPHAGTQTLFDLGPQDGDELPTDGDQPR